jgi:hypothetical protein
MKKIYLIIAITFLANVSFSQIVGTWKLANRAGALAVGPSATDFTWWASSIGDTLVRDCLFDDSLTFDATGGVTHYMDNNSWVEIWQGVPSDQCNTPVPPHDGWGFPNQAPFTYVHEIANGTLTMDGFGAHLGLAKVINGAELAASIDAPASVTYNVVFSNNNNTFIVTINMGTGFWRFTYDRTNAPPVVQANVKFTVDMNNYTGSLAAGVYINGAFNGWCGDCSPMTDIGNSKYEITVPIDAGPIQYKYTIGGWTSQEEFTDSIGCIDNVDDGFYNRFYEVTGDVVLPVVCFNSCDACPNISVSEYVGETPFVVYPNPAKSSVTVTGQQLAEKIEIVGLTGNKVVALDSNLQKSNVISVSNLKSGIYFINVTSSNKIYTQKLIIE